jgi:hypothetical protein
LAGILDFQNAPCRAAAARAPPRCARRGPRPRRRCAAAQTPVGRRRRPAGAPAAPGRPGFMNRMKRGSAAQQKQREAGGAVEARGAAPSQLDVQLQPPPTWRAMSSAARAAPPRLSRPLRASSTLAMRSRATEAGGERIKNKCWREGWLMGSLVPGARSTQQAAILVLTRREPQGVGRLLELVEAALKGGAAKQAQAGVGRAHGLGDRRPLCHVAARALVLAGQPVLRRVGVAAEGPLQDAVDMRRHGIGVGHACVCVFALGGTSGVMMCCIRIRHARQLDALVD